MFHLVTMIPCNCCVLVCCSSNYTSACAWNTRKKHCYKTKHSGGQSDAFASVWCNYLVATTSNNQLLKESPDPGFWNPSKKRNHYWIIIGSTINAFAWKMLVLTLLIGHTIDDETCLELGMKIHRMCHDFGIFAFL